MRIFAVSDLHLDYAPNRAWVEQLSLQDYQGDALILAGDISDRLSLLTDGLEALKRRFAVVLYVPGNHDLWVHREGLGDSFEKFHAVRDIASSRGIHLTPFRHGGLAIVPLLGWYDYSFGIPGDYLKNAWTDYRACRWPEGWDDAAVTRWFVERNPTRSCPELERASKIITFSHFLPRIDVMPERIPEKHRQLYPILGTTLLDEQLRELGASMHVYGHSHVNRHVAIDGVTYVNNAFGYPSEAHHTARQLVHLYTEDG
ncbi:metallophosphoesterase [Dyella mobilis]|uniref:Metallophosphoesterase family protein n=1 Tax=Dyella mobilis TaxID=1849582 RepID=A0ABS2KHC2_9GAMM|nr:metallophosphoesterase [Dyella mobilis]MBM7130569.1 metallophosphoesterase family protein [Dyella mobilis]GLQ97196.1 serine/threonine protein phosphatase [Dyella mobilis]